MTDIQGLSLGMVIKLGVATGRWDIREFAMVRLLVQVQLFSAERVKKS